MEVKEIAPLVRHFVFEADEGPLVFEPGQFVSFIQIIGDKEITRAYSLAAAPDGTNRFELCLNFVEEGNLSPHLFHMQPGDTIRMSEPLGTFVQRDPARDSIWVATGTGIAPFRAFAQSQVRPRSPAVTLLFGVRTQQALLYRDEFERLEADYPQFRFWPTLTRPEPGWRERVGRVQQHLQEAIGGRQEIDFYLCGLRQMVDDVRGMLKEMGYHRKQIRYERYD
jgi:CDP-4-dehydro-6-deoxyglucose reductase